MRKPTMGDSTMTRTIARQRPVAKPATTKPVGYYRLKLREPDKQAYDAEDLVHVIRKGVRCDTEKRGHATPHGRSPLEIVLDASEGFIPLWAKDTTLRWQF